MIALTLISWMIAFFGLWFRNYTFKHPKTKVIPKVLRHTWFAGLTHIICCSLICLPMFFTKLIFFAPFLLGILLYAFRDSGIKLFIDDLKIHKLEGRGIFQHSNDCYMCDGEAASFLIKRRKKIKGEEEPIDLIELIS